MNITVNPQDNPFLVKNNNKFKSTLQSGSIITGLITSRDDDSTIIKFDNNTKFKVDSSQVEGSTGQRVSFEVLDSSNNKLVLKQIKTVSFSDQMNIQQNIKNANVQELYEKAGFAKDSDQTEAEEKAEQTEQQKIDLAVMMLRRKLKYGNATNSKSAMSALISSGINVAKISLATMTKVVTGSKNNNQTPDKSTEEMDALKESFVNKGLSTKEINSKMQIANQLNESGLAVNESNIEQVEKLLSDVSELKNSEIDFVNVLKNNMDMSVKNLLSSKHSNAPKNPLPEGIDAEIETLLASINIQATEENMTIAKTLIANEIDVTSENFDKINFIQNELKSIDKATLIYNAIEQIRSGEPLTSLNLQNLSSITNPVDYNSAMESLSEVGTNTINHLQENNIPVTIDNLINNLQPEEIQTDLTSSNFATKKQIIEIQLRMTSSVMFTLNKSNINITTQPLVEALNNIKEAESEVLNSTLAQMNVEVTPESKALITETFDSIIDVKSTIAAMTSTSILQGVYNRFASFSNYVPELFNGENPVNLENISTTMAKMAQAYDQGIADPHPKFHDDFTKVSEQIAPLLESLGITPTESKIKAASVLVKNNTEVTEENVKEVEAINLKVERLLDKLTPHIASKMLSEGINPLTENIDNMLNYIDAFNDEYGTNAGDNLAKQLIKLEKDKDIDEETLSGIKAIYRALNTINKNGLAAVGSYLDTNRELTLNSLLDSAKTYSQNRGKYNVLDKTISDTATISENFTIGKSIKELINSSVSTERTYEHEQILRFMENANYEGLKELIQENPDIYDEILQTVTDKLIEINKTQNTEELTFLQQVVDEVLNANPETVAQLAKSNLSVNKKNLDTLNKIKEDKSFATKTLQQLFEEENIDISELPEEFTEDLLNTANDSIINLLQNADVDIKSLQLYGEVMNILNMQNALNSSSEMAYKSYPIKLPVSSEITNLQMYVLDENAFNKTETTIAFALNLSNGGEVNAVAKFNAETQSLDVNIVCENDDFAATLQNNQQELVNIFKSFADNNISISIS